MKYKYEEKKKYPEEEKCINPQASKKRTQCSVNLTHNPTLHE